MNINVFCLICLRLFSVDGYLDLQEAVVSGLILPKIWQRNILLCRNILSLDLLKNAIALSRCRAR